MRRLLLLLTILVTLPMYGQGQGGQYSTIRARSSDPSSCATTAGALYWNTISLAIKVCTGTNTWTSSGGGGTPAGASGAVQFNSSGSFGGDQPNFGYNSATHALALTGAITALSYGGTPGNPFTLTNPNDAFKGTISSAPWTLGHAYILPDKNGTFAMTSDITNAGTVTSVSMTVPSWLSVTGSPIMTAGTLAVSAATSQTSHRVVGTGAGTSVALIGLSTADLPFTYSGNTAELGTVTGSLTAGHTIVSDASGNLIDSGTTGGSGTVTTFSAGTLSPLFTTSVATATSTPALSFSLSTAIAHKTFMNNTGSTAAPGFQSIGTGDLPFTYSGNTTKLVTTTGSLTNGDCVSIDASSNFVDSGQSGCGGGGAGGTVTSAGLAAPTGFTVSGSPVITSGTLTWAMPASWTTGDLLLGNGSNSVARLAIGTNGQVLTSNGTTASWTTIAGSVTSVAETFTGGLISVGGSPITSSGTLALTVAGTSGGIPYFSGASTWASSAALTANLPVIGGGAGASPAVGTVTGSTTTFVTATGSIFNGHCASWDASHNLVDSGTVGCSGGGGSSAFSSLTSGTNTTATMTVGTGATLAGSGTGTIDFTAMTGANSAKLLPVGILPSVNGSMGFDNTAKLPNFGSGGSTYKVTPAAGDLSAVISPLGTKVVGIQQIPVNASACTGGGVNLSLSWVGANSDFECIALGLTTSGGSSNSIAKYSTSTNITASLLSDNGTTLTYSGTGGISTPALTLTGTGDVVSQPNGDFAVVSKQTATATPTADIQDFQSAAGSVWVKIDKVGALFPRSFAFSALPASSNGAIVFCSDCNSTCTAGSSTGRMCFRENSAWTH